MASVTCMVVVVGCPQCTAELAAEVAAMQEGWVVEASQQESILAMLTSCAACIRGQTGTICWQLSSFVTNPFPSFSHLYSVIHELTLDRSVHRDVA